MTSNAGRRKLDPTAEPFVLTRHAIYKKRKLNNYEKPKEQQPIIEDVNEQIKVQAKNKSIKQTINIKQKKQIKTCSSNRNESLEDKKEGKVRINAHVTPETVKQKILMKHHTILIQSRKPY